MGVCQALSLSTVTSSPAPRRERLFKELLELGNRTTLQKHVPVRAGGFDVAVVNGDSLTIDAEQSLGATGAAFPGLRDLGICREGHGGVTPTRRAGVGELCSLMKYDAVLAL